MRSTVSRWFPTIVRNSVHSALLGVAALAVVGGVAAGPAQAASAATPLAGDGGSAPAAASAGDKSGGRTDKTATDQDKKADTEKKTAEKKAAKTVAYDFKLQPNYYYCGPAATRIALTAHNKVLSQDQVASLLGTTTDGTNSAVDITRVLNSQVGSGRYHTTEISGQKPTSAQMDKLQADIVRSLSQGDPVVANIAGTVTDTAGESHSYEGGHYLTVVGYTDQGRVATIADPADTVGSPSYQLSTIDLAQWIATRGYSSS